MNCEREIPKLFMIRALFLLIAGKTANNHKTLRNFISFLINNPGISDRL
jgi:hypothetical protein